MSNKIHIFTSNLKFNDMKNINGILKNYGSFLENLGNEKILEKKNVMEDLEEEITMILNKFGWSLNQKKSITDGMVKNGILTINYLKNNMSINIVININDDYVTSWDGGSFSKILIVKGKPINHDYWFPNGMSCSVDFTNTKEGFDLASQLRRLG